MKKIISVLLVFCLSITCLCTNVFADDTTTPVDEEITVMNLYTQNVNTYLSASGSTITYKCNVTGKTTATKISIYLYLQQYVNGSWSNVDSVSKTINGTYGSTSDTFSSTVSGRRYRTEAHVYVYSGSKYEYLESNSTTLIM